MTIKLLESLLHSSSQLHSVTKTREACPQQDVCVLFHDDVDFFYEELEFENSQAVMNSIIKLNSLYTKVSTSLGTSVQPRDRPIIRSSIQHFSDYRIGGIFWSDCQQNK